MSTELIDSIAVVTLFPVGEKEALPFRSLTFASANDTFSVGRASKREEKNMVPEHHNAYFDSRVMSRQHATLGVSADMKVSLSSQGRGARPRYNTIFADSLSRFLDCLCP